MQGHDTAGGDALQHRPPADVPPAGGLGGCVFRAVSARRRSSPGPSAGAVAVRFPPSAGCGWCRFSPPGCARLCRDSSGMRAWARLCGPAARGSVAARGAAVGGWAAGCRGGPPGRALSARSPPLTGGGSARRARRRGRSSPPALRFAALAGPPRLRAAALSRSGGPLPCCRPRPLPSPPVGGGRALPVAAAPVSRRGLLGSPPPCRPSPGPPLPRPSALPRPGVAARLRYAVLAAPGRAWPSGWPFGPPRLLRAGGLAAGRRGRLARPRVGSAAPGAIKVKVKGQGKPLFAALGAAAPRPPVAQGEAARTTC